VPFYPTFLATGNNVTLKGDILRRIVGSRLESTVDRPEERDGFKIPNLLEYVRAHRGALAVAALTILRAYIVAGRPVPTYEDGSKPPPMGAPFDTWANLVRHAVHWATGHDPLATKGEAKTTDKMEQIIPILIDGVATLCSVAKNEELTSGGILAALEADPAQLGTLRGILTEMTKDGRLPSPQQLGNLLGKARGRVRNGRTIDLKPWGYGLWFVREIKPTSQAPIPPAPSDGAPDDSDLPF
jgi:hypothetical protein